MTTITVSPKYQVVIPKEIRHSLKLKPGQKLQVMQLEDKIVFSPIINIKEAKGILKGMNTNFEREEDRI